MIEAGWYPNPLDQTTMRYWDGEAWTEDVAPYPTAAPTLPPPLEEDLIPSPEPDPTPSFPPPTPESAPTPPAPVAPAAPAVPVPIPVPVPLPSPPPTGNPYGLPSAPVAAPETDMKKILITAAAIFGVLILLILTLVFAVKTFTGKETPPEPVPTLAPSTPTSPPSTNPPEPSDMSSPLLAMAAWVDMTNETTGEYPGYGAAAPTDIESTLPDTSSIQVCYAEDKTAYAIYLAEENTDYSKTISEYRSSEPGEIRVITTDGFSPFCGQDEAANYPNYGTYFYGTAGTDTTTPSDTSSDTFSSDSSTTGTTVNFDDSADNRASTACYELNDSSTKVAGAGTGIPFGIGSAEEAYAADSLQYGDLNDLFQILNTALNDNDVDLINSSFYELQDLCSAITAITGITQPGDYSELTPTYQLTWDQLSADDRDMICDTFNEDADHTLNTLMETYRALPMLPAAADNLTRRVGLTAFMQSTCPSGSDLLTGT